MATDIVETERNLRPTTPCLPLTLLRRLHGLTPERVRVMTLTPEERLTLEGQLPVYHAYVEPGNRVEISALLARLRGHYFVPAMAPGLAKAIAEDWANDLARFPLWLVKAACDDYRHSQPIRAPKPANIIAYCQDEIDNERQELREIELALSTKESTAPPPKATAEQISAILEKSGHYKMTDEMRARNSRPSEG